MKKDVRGCDFCGLEVSDISKAIGWVSLHTEEQSYIQIRIPNTFSPSLGCGNRFISLSSNLDFCSGNCFLSFLKSKL